MSAQTLQIGGQFRCLIVSIFVESVCVGKGESTGRVFTVASLEPSSTSSKEQTLKLDLPFCPFQPSDYSLSFHPSFLCPSSTPWPWPPRRLFYSPLLPFVFANHFFPCQQVNCFVLPFPAFITLCKLSDMSSTGARQSTHRANAKIMRFGIINEDKLAGAVLLSARARLHYSLNLPEKMT